MNERHGDLIRQNTRQETRQRLRIEVKEVHGDLIRSKVSKNDLRPAQLEALQQKIIPTYETYLMQLASAFDQKSENMFLKQSVAAINSYKDFIDSRPFTVAGEPARFSPQRKIHSTVMEEFWAMMLAVILCRSSQRRPEHTAVYIGPGEALQNIIFAPQKLANLLTGPTLTDPWFQVRQKNRDCMMALRVGLRIAVEGIEVPLAEKILLPFISVECKQYCDKTMLDNAISAAAHLKVTNPFCLEILIAELNKLSDLNISGSGIDNLYLLRRQQLKEATFKRADGPTDTVDVCRRNPVDLEVVKAVCGRVKRHLNAQGYFWADVQTFLATGQVMGD